MVQRESASTIKADGHDVKVTNLDKVLYPQSGFTKADVINYYVSIAPVLLPQLKDRPVTRIRFPDGVTAGKFFEKNAPRGTPSWARTLTLKASPGSEDEGKDVNYPFVDDVATLIWLANLAVLEMHTPQWRSGPRGGVKKSDRLVIDLDPGEGTGLNECAEAAHIIAERLEKDDLTTYPVTSGSKGIQLYAPVANKSIGDTHTYARELARELAAKHDKKIVSDMAKAKRRGKVLLDWSQNHVAKTTITPYALRARDTIGVAAPRTWEEIAPGLKQLGPEEVLHRLDDLGDIAPPSGAKN